VVDVPYFVGDGYPITMLWPPDEYKMSDTYSGISAYLMNYANVAPGSTIKQIPELDTNEKRVEAIVQALRYCLISDVVTAERNGGTWGVSVSKGPITEYRQAILPPNSSDYPPEKFLKLLDTIPFGDKPAIQMLYKGRALRVPKGSEVDFPVLQIDDFFVKHWSLRIRKPGTFSFLIGVAPMNTVPGMVPTWFPSDIRNNQSQYVTYSFAVFMKIEVERTETNSLQVEDYKTWSDALWQELRKKYDAKLPQQ